MAELVANCPRCGAQSITFDVKAFNFVEKDRYSGEDNYEVFGNCRRCLASGDGFGSNTSSPLVIQTELSGDCIGSAPALSLSGQVPQKQQIWWPGEVLSITAP